jgi:hypothetical protein
MRYDCTLIERGLFLSDRFNILEEIFPSKRVQCHAMMINRKLLSISNI